MDLYFQGLAWFNKGHTPDHLAQARSFFDRALAANSENVDALVGSARADVAASLNAFVADPMAALTAAEANVTRALSLVPDHARGHVTLGFVEIVTKRAAQGIAECEHALELDRNLASAYSFLGLGKIFIGRAEDTEAHVAEALRLSPRDTMAYIWMLHAGLAKLHLGSWEQAAEWLPAGDRSQSKSSATTFRVGRRARAAWSTGRVAFRSPGWSRALPDLRHFPRSRRLHGEERPSDLFDPA